MPSHHPPQILFRDLVSFTDRQTILAGQLFRQTAPNSIALLPPAGCAVPFEGFLRGENRVLPGMRLTQLVEFVQTLDLAADDGNTRGQEQIGRASCRER